MDFLSDVANAVLDASGLKEKVGRSEQVIRLKQRFGMDDIESLSKFEEVYAYALVAYRDNDPAGWLRKGQAIAPIPSSNHQLLIR